MRPECGLPYTQPMRQADALNTRYVLWSYSGAMALSGLLLLALTPDPAVRLMGAFPLAAACFAIPAANAADPATRRRTILWIALAHVALTIPFLFLGRRVLPEGAAHVAAQVLVASVFVLLYLWATVEGELAQQPRFLTTIFGSSPQKADAVRTEYETQLRQAAAIEERHRLARDLHDSVKQQIFAIHTAAATAEARVDSDSPGAREALNQVRGSAREAMTEMEAMIQNLQAAPLEPGGLVQAIRGQCEALAFRTGARVVFSPGALPPARALPPGAAEAVFRIAQEGLSNVARHARARNVGVTLEGSYRKLHLAIHDDGSGYDPDRAPGGMGLAGMRSRASEIGGTLEILSHPGAGTHISLTLPVASLEPHEWKEYRRRTLIFAACFVTLLALALYTRDFVLSVICGLQLIGAIRFGAAWRRTRRLSEGNE